MKVCLIVIDAFGIGAAPDAASYGDEGANTYLHTADAAGLELNHLVHLGLNNIEGVPLPGVDKPEGVYGRLVELSAGKDTTTGHWEIAGLVLERPFPTYPEGFPPEVIAAFEQATGRKALYNGVASGTEIIRRYGAQSRRTGNPIVYTSADSVFQIAAHTESVPLTELYGMCRTAREILCGEHAVARVIARPFVGEEGGFTRTADRRDFSVRPFAPTLLDQLSAAGLTVYAVGKIEDIFAGRGVTQSVHTHSNAEGLSETLAALGRNFSGLIFTNLVDTDMLYGHRRDASGYARALAEIDAFLPRLQEAMGEEDLLILTGDHGCDPTYRGTDHTRECVPLLMWGRNLPPRDLKTLRGLNNVSRIVLDKFGIKE